MATAESSSALENANDVPKESNNEGRESSAEFNNIQDGGHVASAVVTSSLQQNPLGLLIPTASAAQVGERSNFSFIIENESVL